MLYGYYVSDRELDRMLKGDDVLERPIDCCWRCGAPLYSYMQYDNDNGLCDACAHPEDDKEDKSNED